MDDYFDFVKQFEGEKGCLDHGEGIWVFNTTIDIKSAMLEQVFPDFVIFDYGYMSTAIPLKLLAIKWSE